MMRRPRWESMISNLEAMQGTLDEFTHEEVFTHILCFEENLRQNRKLTPKLKETWKCDSFDNNNYKIFLSLFYHYFEQNEIYNDLSILELEPSDPLRYFS
jgi:hypothetical protein